MREPAARPVPVPYLEPVVGAAWWTIGTSALKGGTGTLVLALGLGLSGGLLVALHRRHGTGVRLASGARGKFLRTVGITAALLAVSGSVLGYFSLGELVVPLGAVLVGLASISLAAVLDERPLVAAGALMLVLGAAGAVLALRSAGALYPVGAVGLIAGLLYWLIAAHRGGLLDPRRLRSEARTQRHPQPPPVGPARRGDTRRLPLPGEQDPARRGR
ncbi:hypothetical protein [Pseudonocardia humida]|uniref:Uncharacterized protein n=1 Tax=Pseudonocardia humida TaxID=2800819 RepID=A0ABT0ZUI7_9PSEU|nr:hypothetical protein [Pseudonocardia humida]MCO1654383.1 hypothetical protein [Pseudonocardia humida]